MRRSDETIVWYMRGASTDVVGRPAISTISARTASRASSFIPTPVNASQSSLLSQTATKWVAIRSRARFSICSTISSTASVQPAASGPFVRMAWLIRRRSRATPRNTAMTLPGVRVLVRSFTRSSRSFLSADPTSRPQASVHPAIIKRRARLCRSIAPTSGEHVKRHTRGTRLRHRRQ